MARTVRAQCIAGAVGVLALLAACGAEDPPPGSVSSLTRDSPDGGVALELALDPPKRPPVIRLVGGENRHTGNLFKGHWGQDGNYRELGEGGPPVWPSAAFSLPRRNYLTISLGTTIRPRSVTITSLPAGPTGRPDTQRFRTVLDCLGQQFQSVPRCELQKTNANDLVVKVRVDALDSARGLAINASWNAPLKSGGVDAVWVVWLFTISRSV